jgi:hypothetical protein
MRIVRRLCLLVPLLLAGCSTVSSQVQSFASADRIGPQDRVFVVSSVPAEQQTLEHQNWISLTRQELQKRGIPTTSNQNEATAIAVVGMAIDQGRNVTRTFAIPQYGVTGYSGSQTFGTVNRVGPMATVNATTTYTPQYGVTGYRTGVQTDRLFGRIAILMIGRPTPAGRPPNLLFESRVQSEGECASLGALAPVLVEALFATFPQGGARRVEAPTPTGC